MAAARRFLTWLKTGLVMGPLVLRQGVTSEGCKRLGPDSSRGDAHVRVGPYSFLLVIRVGAKD